MLVQTIKAKQSHKRAIQRDLLLVDLAIHTGLRRSKLANLKIGDIDLEKKFVVVRQGKGFKDRVIPLSSKSMNNLEKITTKPY